MHRKENPSVLVLRHHRVIVIHLRELHQLPSGDQDTLSDSANGDLLVGDSVIEAANADAELVCGIFARI
jgi:hypothetical protein